MQQYVQTKYIEILLVMVLMLLSMLPIAHLYFFLISALALFVIFSLLERKLCMTTNYFNF